MSNLYDHLPKKEDGGEIKPERPVDLTILPQAVHPEVETIATARQAEIPEATPTVTTVPDQPTTEIVIPTQATEPVQTPGLRHEPHIVLKDPPEVPQPTNEQPFVEIPPTTVPEIPIPPAPVPTPPVQPTPEIDHNTATPGVAVPVQTVDQVIGVGETAGRVSYGNPGNVEDPQGAAKLEEVLYGENVRTLGQNTSPIPTSPPFAQGYGAARREFLQRRTGKPTPEEGIVEDSK